MTKLKNYLFLLLCLKIGQRQPQIFSPKVTNICEADVQWKLNFCSETIEATSPALKIIECCKYTAQIFPKLSSDEFCAKFSAFRVTAVTNVGPTCWDQPQPRLHQTFICNSLHNGIVVKPTRNSDSILISTVSSSSHQGFTCSKWPPPHPVHGAVLNKTLCLRYASHLGNPSWHSWHTNRLPWHRDAACLCRVLSPPLEIYSLHNLTNRM